MSTNSVPSRSWLFSNRVLAVAAALGLGSTVLYLILRSRKSSRTGSESIVQEVERKKACGVDAFRHRRFEEALCFFGEAIDDLRKASVKLAGSAEKEKLDELLSSCENNNAACYDALGDTESCLLHCALAIQIKPNYVKAMVRRAKCNVKLGRHEKALNDYLDLINVGNVSQESLNVYQSELDKAADVIIGPVFDEIMQSRIDKPMKISQLLVCEWLYSTVTNDPIQARMANLANDVNSQQSSGLDVALLALKRGEYDKIASLAIPIVDDETIDLVEKMLAVLLAARFLHYQTLDGQALEIAQKFDNFWDKLDEEQKLVHKDVHVAYITLQLSLIRLIENELMSSSENLTINKTNKERCYQLVDHALNINPKNVDPLLLAADLFTEALTVFQKAKNIDPKHPFIRFYEIHGDLSLAVRQESFVDIQKQMFQLEQALQDSEKVPMFAFIILSRFAMLFQNNQLAAEACKKLLEKMSNCSYAIFLSGLLDCNPNALSDRAAFATFVKRTERAMRKAIEADANNWEPYRMLGKISADKQVLSEAVDFYSAAIALARKRDELMVLLKERLMVTVFVKRKNEGKKVHLGVMS
ncbi:TOM (translocase of outer membrane) complex component [Globodera pallida]|nr:TOM (translocase of outer membrane) complex component [Globodera pallida]